MCYDIWLWNEQPFLESKRFNVNLAIDVVDTLAHRERRGTTSLEANAPASCRTVIRFHDPELIRSLAVLIHGIVRRPTMTLVDRAPDLIGLDKVAVRELKADDVQVFTVSEI